MRALASGSQANGQGGNIHGVVLAVLTGEEQTPWLGQPGAVCMKTYNYQRDDQKKPEQVSSLTSALRSQPLHVCLSRFSLPDR